MGTEVPRGRFIFGIQTRIPFGTALSQSLIHSNHHPKIMMVWSCSYAFWFLQVPSMRQLHLHIISQDFNSASLKNKKHWNSFTTTFFLDSVDVIEEIDQRGSATISSDDRVLAMELRCHRCRSAHPNIPKLKSHIASCKSSFPSHLLQIDWLLSSSTMHMDCT